MLALANRLRQDGIDALVDQYNPVPPQGWPLWMEQEIQAADFVLLVCTETYLRRVEGREQAGKGRGVVWEGNLIRNLLYPEDAKVQRFIPILFADGQPSSIPLPLRGLMYYWVDTEQGYEDLYRYLTNQPHYQMPELGEIRSLLAKPLPPLSPREPQSYPSSPAAKSDPKPKPPSSLDQRHRRQLLKQVRLDWIEGVLNQSLYKVARLELGLTHRTDAVEQPLNAVVHVPDRSPQPIQPGTRISQVFDEQAGALLILGAPGAGKSTFLLELAQDLLDRADCDESQPIPVVFPLSSWAARRQPLAEWLMAELNQRSYVPKKEARQWVEAEQILPLLDGLDEVAAPFREACVEAINQFRREHSLLPIVVCSRIADYEALGTKLRLRTAVEVQPLAKRQIKDYLARVGEPLQGLRTALEADASLWELLETPLMLWVAMLAYRDVPLASLQGNTLEQRQRHLFAHFVEAMLRRRAGLTTYTAEQIKHWLSRLASALARNNQTVFYLENLDFQWLHTHTPRWLARVGIILATGLLANLLGDLLLGLIFGLNFLFGGLLYGRSKLVFFGLPLGFVVGIVSIVIKVKPVEKMVFHWTDLSSRRSTAIRSGLSAGLLIGLLYGLNFGLLTGLSGGLGVGLLVGLVRLFTSEATAETRSIPNQGTHRSLKVALISGVIFGPISASIFELIHVLAYGSLAGQVDVVSGGLGIGLLVGLFCGGAFSIKHFALRFSLWLSRAAPLRYVAFLAHAKDLLFLRQVGGGYIFTHRLLQEYFASLSQASCEFSIRLNASLEQVTPEVQTQILSNLRKVSGDSNLQIDSIYPGSVLIRLKGTVEGYRIIAELVRSGNLTDVLGMPIEEVSLITANAGPNLINDGEIQGGCEVFVSYSHKGRRFRDQLCSHMKVLERQGLVKIWHDRKIVAGTQWMEEIDERLNKASIILLLISPDFLASDYCYGVEVEKAIARHKEGQARVIPIILRQADWQTTLLGGLQALPSNGKPISQWADRDRAFHQICQELRVVISQLASSIPPR